MQLTPIIKAIATQFSINYNDSHIIMNGSKDKPMSNWPTFSHEKEQVLFPLKQINAEPSFYVNQCL